MRVGIFADVRNLYNGTRFKFPGRKLSYEKFYAKCKQFGDIVKGRAYINLHPEINARSFIDCLQIIGFETIIDDSGKRFDWDVTLALDVIQMIDRLDIVVLGSNDRDLVPLVRYLDKRGISSIVVAAGVSLELRHEAARCIEITGEMLDNKVINMSVTDDLTIDQDCDLDPVAKAIDWDERESEGNV